jgi:mobilization protein NikA
LLAKWSSPAQVLEYPWTMSRTLFDVDDTHEAKTEERTLPRPRRAAIVPVRLTAGERDQLAEVARDLGISLSTYMRQAVLSRPLPPRRAVRPIPEVNRETYHALGRLAADVNVIARRTAERRREPGAPDVLEALELVTRFLGTVRAEVLGTTLTPEGGES